uniref:VWFA domain-containing protein n=1 Tax=Rousettus aegyptiacus TaxID=9407 RepID=A0A7J8EJH1_ROUAE|nr:hypothetical protein HJG63_006947 [Rousettus aegyptiacus]
MLQDQSAFSSSGIMADFVVQYDVVTEDIIGDVQIYEGYFVHFFGPRGLPPVEKNVVFVIDVGSSMFGAKMKQTKKAMNVILGDLQANDYFNIISFSDTVSEELEAPYRPPPRMFKVPRTAWATWKLMVLGLLG